MAAAAGSADQNLYRTVNEEFLEHYSSNHDKTKLPRLRAYLKDIAERFQMHDDDGSGDIDLEEVEKALRNMGKKKSKAELKAMISRVDDDNTGTLRYREFINMMLIEEGFLSEPVPEEDDEQASPRRRGTSTRTSSAAKMVMRHARRKGAVKKKKRGHLRLSLTIQRAPAGLSASDHLVVRIEEARDLLRMDIMGLSDPYVKMYLEPDPSKKTKQKTQIIYKTLTPVWNEEFHFDLGSSAETAAKQGKRIHLSVWDYDRLTRNDFMGAMSFSLEEVLDADSKTDGWFILLDDTQGAKQNFVSREHGLSARKQTTVRRPHPKQPASAAGAKKYTSADFNYLKVLGRGNFGKVMLAEDKKTKKLYAIKVLKKIGIIEDNDMEQTLTEKRILAIEGDPPFLTRLYASFQTPANLFFVMELVQGGDLMFHVIKAGSLSERATCFYSAEIICGLWFLHSHGILYRDLKLDNVMIDHEGHVRIADFGLAKEGVYPGMKTATFCGTPDYIAPEIIKYKPYNEMIDFWSLGVLMYMMLVGEAPFDGEEEDVLFRNICKQEISMPRFLTAGARQVLKGLLDRNPEKRLGAGASGQKDIMGHPFYTTINWDKLKKRELPPPIKPDVKKDAREAANFDPEFTSEKPKISPTDKGTLANIPQDAFPGFTYYPGLVVDTDEAGKPMTHYSFRPEAMV